MSWATETDSGEGQVFESKKNRGSFWFFSDDNLDMVVKVIDECGFNDHFWVFAEATTNVEYTLMVTDTATGATKAYSNELGVASPAVTDTSAFATCP